MNSKKLARNVVIGAGVGLYLYLQNTWLQVTKVNLPASGKLAGLKGLKIVQLSDLHFPNQGVKISRLISKVAKEKPDLIVISGDIIEGKKPYQSRDMHEFAKGLTSIAPTYATLGNHDIKSNLRQFMVDTLEEEGVVFLQGNPQVLTFKGQEYLLMGVDSAPRLFYKQMENLSSVAFKNDWYQLPKLLVSHRPETFENFIEDPDKAPQITFAGHAHGGQVRLPIFDGLFAPDQGILPSLTAGVFRGMANPESLLVISRGIGASSFPFRINNRPEVIVATIH